MCLRFQTRGLKGQTLFDTLCKIMEGMDKIIEKIFRAITFPDDVFLIFICCFTSKPQRLKHDRGQKSGQILHFLTLVQLREELASLNH